MAPLDVDGVVPVAALTAAWAVALIVTVLSRASLDSAGRGWWVGVCVAGVIVGLGALGYVVRRRRVYRAAPAGPATPT